MIDYIIAFLAFLSIYKGAKFFFSWEKITQKSYPMNEGRPFFWKKGKTGVLLIHGFTSTAHEMIKLGKYLHKNGLTVYAPLVAGHGTTPQDLSHTKLEQWESSTEEALNKLKREVDKVYIAGSSFGGNLAFLLAEKHKVDGLISLGTPLFFRKDHIIRLLLPFIKKFKKFQTKRYLKRDLKKKGIHGIHYTIIPLNAVSELLKGIKKTKKILPKVTAPTLIMQSTTDYQLNKKNALKICRLLGSEYKNLMFIPDSYHVLVRDPSRKEIFKNILAFIKEDNKS